MKYLISLLFLSVLSYIYYVMSDKWEVPLVFSILVHTFSLALIGFYIYDFKTSKKPI